MNQIKIANLANFVTVLRVLLILPIAALIIHGQTVSIWGALVLMLIAEATDGIDGYVARRYRQVSSFGKLLDPMADSLYRMSVFTVLVAVHWLPLWLLLIAVGRDVVVAYLRVYAEQNLGTLAARNSGKLKAIVQGVLQIATVAAFGLFGFTTDTWTWDFVMVLVIVTASLTLYSLFDYASSVLQKIAERK